MLKKLFLSAISIVCLSPFSNGKEYKFADITWNSSREITTEILGKKGYVPRIKENGDLIFVGELMGRKIQGYCSYNPQGQLVKILVKFQVAKTNCLDLYKKVKEQLLVKYENPTSDFESYLKPYEKGDGYAEQAVKMNKATIATYWISDSGACYIEVTQKLEICVSYESKDWSSEHKRRQNESAKDL